VATRAKQYTNWYYVSFALIHASSASTFMHALPSDNTKVKALATVACCKYLTAAVCSAYFACRTLESVREGTCSNCAMSRWEVWFWGAQCVLATSCLCFLLRVRRATPVVILNKLWRAVGVYFIVVGLVGLVDHAMSVLTGVYDVRGVCDDGLCSSVKWNLLLTTEELAVGLLSSSSRFKIWIWTKAAATSNIRLVCYRRTTDLSPTRRGPTGEQKTDDERKVGSDDDTTTSVSSAVSVAAEGRTPAGDGVTHKATSPPTRRRYWSPSSPPPSSTALCRLPDDSPQPSGALLS